MAAKKQVRSQDDGRDRLRKELAESLVRRIEDDAFFASDFFSVISDVSKASDDGSGVEALESFKLIDMVIGDRRADVKRIVGSSTKDVFAFITEVVSSSDVKTSDGDTLEK